MNAISKEGFLRPESTDYPLQGDEVDWFTGSTPTGDQLLVVVQFPNVIVVSFTQGGYLTGVTSLTEFSGNSPFAFFSLKDVELLRCWFEQIGFRRGLITVKRFSLPEYHIEIKDIDEYFVNILLHPNMHSREEIDNARLEVEYWSTQGQFQLWLNEFTDLWIDRTGTTVAT